MKKIFYLLTLTLWLCASCSDADEGVDSTDSTAISRNVSISGVTQKGPFITGTQVTISELDTNLSSTGMSYQTQLTDDLGNFAIEFNTSGSYGEYIASGYYFDETSGALSSAQLTLRAVAEIDNNVNINILTTLQIDRVKTLVSSDGLTVEAAIEQSQQEVLAVFGVSDSSVNSFDSMDISESGASNSILLAISATLQQGRSVAEMSELISRLSLDIADNGVVDTQTLIDSFLESSVQVNCDAVCENLENKYNEAGYNISINNFVDYLAVMWGNIVVTFESNGGSEVSSQAISYTNYIATEPATPTRNSYTFDGWYANENLTQQYNFTTTVTDSITLYAKWVETSGDELQDLDHNNAW
ncbi:MAG: InlB B-repeat-containing protein [Rikenellaceae bacterium]